MKIVERKPQRFVEELYLQGDFAGHVEFKFLDKKSNKAEEVLADFSYGDKIIEVLKAKSQISLSEK